MKSFTPVPSYLKEVIGCFELGFSVFWFSV